jgi:hypothetical protein
MDGGGYFWMTFQNRPLENGHMSLILLALFVAGSSDKYIYILHPRSSLLGLVCR